MHVPHRTLGELAQSVMMAPRAPDNLHPIPVKFKIRVMMRFWNLSFLLVSCLRVSVCWLCAPGYAFDRECEGSLVHLQLTPAKLGPLAHRRMLGVTLVIG